MIPSIPMPCEIASLFFLFFSKTVTVALQPEPDPATQQPSSPDGSEDLGSMSSPFDHLVDTDALAPLACALASAWASCGDAGLLKVVGIPGTSS